MKHIDVRERRPENDPRRYEPLPLCQLENMAEFVWSGEPMTSNPAMSSCIACIQRHDGDNGGTRESAVIDPLRVDLNDWADWSLLKGDTKG